MEVEIPSSSVPGEEARKAMRERALLNYREKLSSESRLRAENERAESRYALKTAMKVTASPSLRPRRECKITEMSVF